MIYVLLPTLSTCEPAPGLSDHDALLIKIILFLEKFIHTNWEKLSDKSEWCK